MICNQIKLCFLFLCHCFGTTILLAQDTTVGLLLYEENTFEGLTLFSPSPSTDVYLIDNCGRIINTWNCSARPGLSVYLHTDGSIYRAANDKYPQIQGASSGGIIERYDWENNLLWTYKYSSEFVKAHHDFQVLPNGNVLILAWEIKQLSDVIDAGKNIQVLQGQELRPEHIVEVQPTSFDTGLIVWEWHAWDHLIQDYDPEKNNYGVVSDNPVKIDVNYTGPGHDDADWMHANSIAYNAELDQIMVSSNCFDEIWVIDHSITSEEASGEKGDILFRWGNPQTYKRGTPDDKQLFGQHSAHWISKGLPDENKIMVFNNGKGRPEGKYSSVVKINPVIENGKYLQDLNQQFLPATFDYEYTADPPTSFYSAIISSAQQLPNGNILINDGVRGTFFEITNMGKLVWKYVNPVTSFGIASQGDIVPSGQKSNSVFKAHKYALSYHGFDGKDLSPGQPVELNPHFSNCETVNIEDADASNFNIYPNPANSFVKIEGNSENYILFNILGQSVITGRIPANGTLDLSSINSGLYFLRFDSNQTHKIYIQN